MNAQVCKQCKMAKHTLMLELAHISLVAHVCTCCLCPYVRDGTTSPCQVLQESPAQMDDPSGTGIYNLARLHLEFLCDQCRCQRQRLAERHAYRHSK